MRELSSTDSRRPEHNEGGAEQKSSTAREPQCPSDSTRENEGKPAQRL